MRKFGALCVLLVSLAAGAGAAEEGMPPMGPPEEMKMMASMVGQWEVTMQSRQTPEQPWEESIASCSHEMILDGAALLQKFNSTMMGMPFKGESLMCFNRETQKWQVTWIDNLSCQMSLYEGEMKDGKMVVSGEDMWQGMKYWSRSTTYNITDSTFEWTMENSTDGGATWYETLKAVYTKKK